MGRSDQEDGSDEHGNDWSWEERKCGEGCHADSHGDAALLHLYQGVGEWKQ